MSGPIDDEVRAELRDAVAVAAVAWLDATRDRFLTGIDTATRDLIHAIDTMRDAGMTPPLETA